MSQIPKVSIIMSVYNGGKYLHEAIESILNQTFIDFEFIIVDDASNDNSSNILTNYAAQDRRIKLITNKHNIGLTKSLNKGLRIARGSYIARQDADDISHPERLGHEVSFLDNNSDVGLTGSHVSLIDKTGREFSTLKPPTNHDEIRNQLLRGNSFCHGSVMFRRSCVPIVGFYREQFKYTQDYDLWLRISEHFKVANIDKILYQHRRTSSAIARRHLSEQLNYHLLAQELAKERHRSGRDNLNIINSEDIENVLVRKFKISTGKIRKFKAEVFMVRFSESLNTKNYLNAVKMWLGSLFLDPRNWKLRYFIEQIYKLVVKRLCLSVIR